MTETRRIRVAITHGDTNSTNYEEIFKAFSDPMIFELCTPIIYGSAKVAAYHRKALGITTNHAVIEHGSQAQDGKLNILNATSDLKVELGIQTEESAQAGRQAVDRAIKDFGEGLFDVLVTMPFALTPTTESGKQVLAIHEYIAQQTGESDKLLPVIIDDNMLLGIAAKTPQEMGILSSDKDMLEQKLNSLFTALSRDFRSPNPRMAVLSLNEKDDMLTAAIDSMKSRHIAVGGPYSAPDFFAQGMYRLFDGVMTLYTDQALIPLKLLSPNDGTLVSTGTHLVATAPIHDAIYENADKGEADENALRQAIYHAIDISRNRVLYDEPLSNPLKKLYHEKRDESEKVRFAIPKKKDEIPPNKG